MKEWLKQFYGEHKWLSILAVAALVLGILFLCIGFWRTLLLAALVALGVRRYISKKVKVGYGSFSGARDRDEDALRRFAGRRGVHE